jgi:anaerobic ribonucleoside-triphosphate reductase activating protein
MTDVEDIANRILADDLSNVTFSGGDPMFQPLAFAELARIIKQRSNKDIWCYTGYTYERIIKDAEKRQLLEQVDVLVDGPFVQSLRDENLLFRGSSNQRLIDVKKSLAAGHVVQFEYNPFPEFVTNILN